MDASVSWTLSPDPQSLLQALQGCCGLLQAVVGRRHPRRTPEPAMLDAYVSERIVRLLELVPGWRPVTGGPLPVDEALRPWPPPASCRQVGVADGLFVWEDDIIGDLKVRLVASFDVGSSIERYYGNVVIDVSKEIT